MREVTVNSLSEWINAGEKLTLIDVREEWEYSLGALSGSVHIPLGELSQRVDELGEDTSKTVVTICHHGVRSLHAAAYLQSAGYTRVFSLRGGTDAWSREIDRNLARY